MVFLIISCLTQALVKVKDYLPQVEPKVDMFALED